MQKRSIISFLKEFKLLTELVNASGPTLSFISLLELKIRKMCKINPTDDDWLKEVKTNVAANVGKRIASNEAAKIQRVLDPGTKELVPKETAVGLLEAAVQKCRERGIFSLDEQDEQGEQFISIHLLYFGIKILIGSNLSFASECS